MGETRAEPIDLEAVLAGKDDPVEAAAAADISETTAADDRYGRVLPKTFVVETWTILGTPASIAASRTRSVPPTLTASIRGRADFGIPILYSAAAWTTALHPSTPAAIAAFDVALQPAVVEYASPLKLFEYLFVGLPIVAPDSANIREVLSDGDNGLLFHPDSESSFHAVLGRLLADEDLRRRLASRATETVRLRDLTWAGNARRVTRLAESLAEGRTQTCAL